jgi:hypothetical protein
MQKGRITSRLFSRKSTVEYIKSKLPDTAPKVLTTIGITAGITFLLTSYAPLKEISKDTGLDVAISDFSGPLIMDMIAGDLTLKLCETSASITEFDNVGDGSNYVTRPSMEKRILQASEKSLKDKGGVYTILVGAKGAGKTSAVARVLREKKGVVAVLVSDKDTPGSLVSKLVKKCGIKVTQGLDIDLEDFGPVLLKAAEIRKGRPITIVFEVERSSTSVEILKLIKNFTKYLAVYANVIIVLSEANAGLVFSDDERQKILWVDEMDTEEAKEYARKLHPDVSDADLNLLFDKVGKLPLKILNSMTALKEGIPVAQVIDDAVLAAEADFIGFKLEPILAALKASPDGVHIRAFNGVKYEGADLGEPAEVAVFMKMKNCLVYHMPSKEYRLASRAHRTALMQYNPPVEVVCPPVVVK